MKGYPDMAINKNTLLVNSSENRELFQREDQCDKFDYITAVACGAIGGMIDIFFVGYPRDSALGSWTDHQVDNAVSGFAHMLGWDSNTQNVSAIGFLEGKSSSFQGFKVNYDQSTTSDVGNLFNISPSTHHMMSLAHSPDIIGLFFYVLNQFASTSTFLANGQLITIATDTYELLGGNFITKIMCGIANWFGHLMSDVAGSSGAHGRGTGIVIPFYELFGVCRFGSFSTRDGRKDLSEVAMKAFTQGYDLRYGLTMAIPVVVTELSIRLIWAIRRRFQYHMSLRECIPSSKYASLRVMLLVGNGTLCVMDGFDAAIRFGGNFLLFFMRLNLVAWFRFAMLVIKEVFIRIGIMDSLQKSIEAFKRINEALQVYLNELEKIDLALFRKETEQYNKLVTSFNAIKTDKELTEFLLNTCENLGISKPWKGDFDSHMSNKNGTLVFK